MAKKKSRTKANWEKAERDYVYAVPKKSYATLAEELGVKPETVAKHGMKSGWVEKRQKVQDRLSNKQFEDRLTEQIIGSLDLVDSAQMSAKILIDTILKISVRILDSSFSEDIESINSAKMLDVLATLSNSLDRILKTLSVLTGGPSESINYSLIDVLSNPDPSIGVNR